ncbi:serine--tRNA ligase [Methanothermobacter marburgensis]|uniref:Type-2 serine--tRNA ligase n=1 Tax=Methanothermobacter marburgensis (strain ATCC BAA-927 / DSM 2133 / JCM 14651 / NBRC 100331 / OCM 82 / Marburg) TaxID=79929 RepID=D9PXY6_METTM|nr:serine--tRNA ligase [Methanothermobacter marburgensis]ADL59084.1 seryl-tRNA synthetase [Methanothermobacter marburgensis str. Marburg]WBF09604.1 serine--tRNA ligase [Methanothermobacter marburgensis]
MKFKLKGIIKLSKEVPEAEKDIEEFLKEAEKDILRRGVPEGQEKEASHVKSWELTGDTLKLEMESGRRVRAHDGLLRLKKPLGQLLGPRYRVGVRGVKVEDYTLEMDAPGVSEIPGLRELPFVEDADISQGIIRVRFQPLDESELRKHVVDRVVKHALSLVESSQDLTTRVTRATPGEIVARSEKREFFFDGDPTEEAMRLGWVKKFPGRGQWFYGPQITALHRALEEFLIERIVKPLGFVECLFPKLIPLDVMNRMRYLEGLPEGMYYCSAPSRDPQTFEEFKNELIINREVPMDLLKRGLKDPGYVIAPAQCEPFYQFLSHEVVNLDDLPIKFFDRSGWTYRWEAGGAKGLDRVHEFQRIELVWLASPRDTEEIRDRTVELSYDAADELELEWYTEVGDDPFYLEGRRVEERGIEFPDVPKYEMRLSLPGQEKGVAVVSANVHGTHFIEGFSIREARNMNIWTGCTGIGLSRWIYGFLAQKGFDTEKWPEFIRERVDGVEAPRIVTWPGKD